MEKRKRGREETKSEKEKAEEGDLLSVCRERDKQAPKGNLGDVNNIISVPYSTLILYRKYSLQFKVNCCGVNS